MDVGRSQSDEAEESSGYQSIDSNSSSELPEGGTDLSPGTGEVGVDESYTTINLDSEEPEGIGGAFKCVEDFAGKEFASEEEALDAYKAFARFRGFGVRKGDIGRVNGVVVRRDFFCHRHGLRRAIHYDRPDRMRQEKMETRTDCKARMKNFMEMMLKSFEALQARVDEGFAKITDRIDSIDISLISQAEEMRMLRDRFLELVGEVPPTTEPTAEAPTEVDEVTRTDDPTAEDGTEVAPVVADQGEGVQAATETTEVVQEQSVESPAHD
ncbi:hypothetical protein PIB30_058510 [Stylosanthes scabra]|uniref:FAR1 domain-containing protein n=1 Tax=Stylosanthes scabra TaxID=79078 RepID=A0ABU6VM11_9FABA|nr:hypothetical protein [Stylosanthes scabra]